MVRLKPLILLVHALLGWAVCGGTVALGRQLLPLNQALIVHAVIAPLVFAALSWHYFKRFPFSSPLGTALAFLTVVVGLDLFVVAPLFEHNYAMFTSALGTWIPFALIFTASYVIGWLARNA